MIVLELWAYLYYAQMSNMFCQKSFILNLLVCDPKHIENDRSEM